MVAKSTRGRKAAPVTKAAGASNGQGKPTRLATIEAGASPNVDDTGKREVRPGQLVVIDGPTVGRVVAVDGGTCLVRPLWADHGDVTGRHAFASNCCDTTIIEEPASGQLAPSPATTSNGIAVGDVVWDDTNGLAGRVVYVDGDDLAYRCFSEERTIKLYGQGAAGLKVLERAPAVGDGLPGEAGWIVRLACDLATIAATVDRINQTHKDPPWHRETGQEMSKGLDRTLELLWESAGAEVWLNNPGVKGVGDEA